jgi:putative transposase
MGIGEIKLNYYRQHLGNPKAITVKREGRKWWLSLRCVDIPANVMPPNGREVGVDLGVVNIVATSDGDLFIGERFGSKAKVKLADAQRSLSSMQRGSNRRKRQVEAIARLHRKIKNRRKNAAHQLSRRLVNDYEFIALEDLAIVKMTASPKAKPDPNDLGHYLPNGKARKSGLNRSILDAGWGHLAGMITYKAESAGRMVVKVNPCHTSQRCAECGHILSSNRVGQAVFVCQSCGHEDHADTNAARNILWAGRAQRALARTASN